MLVIYTNICTPCKYRRQLNHVREIARNRQSDVIVKESKYRSDIMIEARSISDLSLPFVYDTDTDCSYPLSTIERNLSK